MNLVIVDSPLQLINSIELCHHLNFTDVDLLIKISGDKQKDKLLFQISKFYNWKNLSYIYEKKRLFLLSNLLLTRKIKDFVSKNISYDNVIFGDFRSRWMQFVRLNYIDSNFYIVDDGDVILSIEKKYFCNRIFSLNFGEDYYSKSLLSYIKNIYFDMLNYDFNKTSLLINKQINIFSSFVLDSEYINNTYSYFRSLRTSKTNKKIAYHFGSKYSEANIVSLDYEMRFISSIYQYYQNINVEMVYIPHRSDGNKKLEMIKGAGVTIQINEFPAEIFLLLTNVNPLYVSGGCTSVLNNVRHFYTGKLISFLLNKDEIKSEYLQDIIVTYESYKVNNIEIMDLN